MLINISKSKMSYPNRMILSVFIITFIMIAALTIFSISVIAENHPPVIDITHPEHGSTVDSIVEVKGTTEDPDEGDEIEGVWIRIDEGEWQEATDTSEHDDWSSWERKWNTKEFENGWHDITAKVYDGEEHGDDSIEVKVENGEENHPPVIDIKHPEHGSTVDSVVEVKGTTEDPDENDEIEGVWVRIDEGEWQEATDTSEHDDWSSWEHEWNTKEFENGWHDITAKVYDGEEHGDDSIEVKVENGEENHAPVIDIKHPEHGSTVDGVVEVKGTTEDPDEGDEIEGVWVRIDEGEWHEATDTSEHDDWSSWVWEWNTKEFENGWHDITAKVYDGEEHGDDVTEVKVENGEENHAPNIEITHPEHEATVHGTVLIKGSTSDEDGDEIESVYVYFDDKEDKGGYAEDTSEGEQPKYKTWRYEWNTREFENGWHHIHAVAYDGKEHGSDMIGVKVENEGENHAPNIEITHPEHEATVHGTVLIKGITSDEDGDEIESVYVYFDDKEDKGVYAEDTSEGEQPKYKTWRYEWNSREFENGWHHIHAVAYDGKEHGSDMIGVKVENEGENYAPNVEITHPEHEATVHGTILIKGSTSDENGDEIESVYVYFDDKEDKGGYAEDTSEGEQPKYKTWRYEWNTREFENGWHHIHAVAYDGNEHGSDKIGVTVENGEENKAPFIDIKEPEHESTVDGIVVVKGVAEDPNEDDEIEGVWVRIDEGEWHEATDTSDIKNWHYWSFEWDTTKYDNAWHRISAKAYDGEKYEDDSIEVKVENNEENHAPEIYIIYPEHENTLDGIVVVEGEVEDPDGGEEIEGVWIRIDEGEWHEAIDTSDHGDWSTWEFDWDTTKNKDGWYRISAKVYDGEKYGDDHKEVKVSNEKENHPPKIEITQPGNGDTIHGTIIIKGVTNDVDGDEIESVYIYFNDNEKNGGYADDTSGEEQPKYKTWKYEWNTGEFENGWHAVHASVYDGQKLGTHTIELNVQNDKFITSDDKNEDPQTQINDVQVYELSFSEVDIIQNSQIEIYYYVINNGNFPTTEFQSYLYIDDVLISENTFSSLSIGEEFKITLDWVVNMEVGEHKIKVIVDPENKVQESNEENNVIEQSIEIKTKESTDSSEEIINKISTPMIIGSIGLVTVFSSFLLFGSEIGKFKFLSLLFLPLYTRIRKENVLDNETRGMIKGYILANPGDHYNSIKKSMGLSNGTLAHHLNILEKNGYIKSANGGMYKRFYPKGMNIPTSNGGELSEIQKMIVKKIKETPGISQKDIASLLGVSAPTIKYHIDRLVNNKIIKQERKGIFVGYYCKDSNKE